MELPLLPFLRVYPRESHLILEHVPVRPKVRKHGVASGTDASQPGPCLVQPLAVVLVRSDGAGACVLPSFPCGSEISQGR